MDLKQIQTATGTLRFDDLKRLKAYIDTMVALRAQNGDDLTEAPES